jgi:hypothetical protein
MLQARILKITFLQPQGNKMVNQNEFHLTATYEQLSLLIELVTQHVALSKMTLNKLTIPVLRNRLELKINHDMLFLEYLRAKRDSFTSQVPSKI